MRPIKSFGERIADALVEDGLLFRKQVEELMEQQKREGTRLLKIIIDKAYVTEQDMAVSMGRVLNTPPVNLNRLGIATGGKWPANSLVWRPSTKSWASPRCSCLRSRVIDGSTRAELTSPECRQLHPMQIQQRTFFGRIATGCAGYYNRYSQLRLVQAAPERIGHHDALKSPRQRM